MFFSVWSLPSLSKKSVPFVLEWPFSQYVMIMHWIEKNVNFQNFSCKFSISRKLSNKFPPPPSHEYCTLEKRTSDRKCSLEIVANIGFLQSSAKYVENRGLHKILVFESRVCIKIINNLPVLLIATFKYKVWKVALVCFCFTKHPAERKILF